MLLDGGPRLQNIEALGIPALATIADAAYIASASAEMAHVVGTMAHTIGGSRHQAASQTQRPPPPFFEDAVERVAAKLPRGHAALENIRGDADSYKQQHLSLAIAEVEAQARLSTADSIAAATMQACSAPGACRWLLKPPAIR